VSWAWLRHETTANSNNGQTLRSVLKNRANCRYEFFVLIAYRFYNPVMSNFMSESNLVITNLSNSVGLDRQSVC